MVSIDEGYAASSAPNAEALKNGRGLLAKGKFVALHTDAAGTLLFAQCQGSGKEPYHCSADFVNAGQPTYRCSCPSRQFPCKHCVGLLLAYAAKPASFTVAEPPADLTAKRSKLADRAEKKKEEADKPKAVNKSALAKKIKAQLDGLALLETLTVDLTRVGIGNTNAKSAREIEDKAKQLANAYLPGAQAALHRYTGLFGDKRSAPGEAVFSEALDNLTRLHALVKQGRAYLTRRLDDPDLKPDTDSSIAAWLGHAWQLAELKAAGRVRENAELLQLAFNTYDDTARQEYVDTGTWMNLADGRIVLTQTFRPYKAAKYIKSDDSFFQVARVKALYVYPGDVNPRVRWEDMTPRPVMPDDLRRLHEHARADFAATIKEVKTSIRAPLADKQPIHALRFARIGRVGGVPVVEDAHGQRITLTDDGMTDEPASCHLLGLVPPALLSGGVMVGRFRHDLDRCTLSVKPLSLVGESGVVRLTL